MVAVLSVRKPQFREGCSAGGVAAVLFALTLSVANGQGVILGKAMSSLEQGRGMVLVLVSLQ